MEAAQDSAAAEALNIEPVAAADWVAQSLSGLKPVRAGRVIVHGAHDRARVRPNDIGIEIEAALAFGTGHHGTTRGCLLLLDDVLKARRPRRVLDLGTGTGVLAAVLARRGLARVIATDQDPRALACALANIEKLGMRDHVEVVEADLFPEGRAALVLCNPPWVPARPSSPLEHGIYDPDSRMLKRFLAGLAAHLLPEGEGWLILSDLAEHLGLRTRAELVAAIDAAGLRLLGRNDVRPAHPKAFDATEPLHAARAAEVTSLWRLAAR